MKAIIAIQSSEQELYQKHTNTLLELYDKMKKAFNLKIEFDIMPYTIRTEGDVPVERIGSTLYVTHNDNQNVYIKHRGLMQYLNEHPEYDIILKTNSTTLVNLKFIDDYVNTYMDAHTIYCGRFEGVKTHMYTSVIFPIGNMLMFTREVYDKHFSDIELYDSAYNRLKTAFGDSVDQSSHKYEPVDRWNGIPEDMIWAEMRKITDPEQNVHIETIPGYHFESLWDVGGWGVYNKVTVNPDTMFKYCAFVTVKNQINYEDRIKLEPVLLKMVYQIMITNPDNTIYFTQYALQ